MAYGTYVSEIAHINNNLALTLEVTVLTTSMTRFNIQKISLLTQGI
jgi:hypothetical protein